MFFSRSEGEHLKKKTSLDPLGNLQKRG